MFKLIRNNILILFAGLSISGCTILSRQEVQVLDNTATHLTIRADLNERQAELVGKDTTMGKILMDISTQLRVESEVIKRVIGTDGH